MRSQHRFGLTLIEILVSILLVSMVLIVSLSASANLLRNDHQQQTNTRLDDLSAIIMDEITSRHFQDPDTPIFGIESDESSASRLTLDDVDDYHNYTQSTPTYRNGDAITGFDGWSISVNVSPATVDSTGVVTSVDNNDPLRMITLTCTSPDGEQTTSRAIVSNTPIDLPDSVPIELWRKLDLNFADRTISVTAPLRNQPDSL